MKLWLSVGVAAVAAVVATGAFGASSVGRLTTIAGGGEGNGEGIPAKSAKLFTTDALAVDGQGNVYVSEAIGSSRVRKISRDGTIRTVAGTSDLLHASLDDGIPATSARIDDIEGLAVDRRGNLYIADRSLGNVRKVSPGGTITTFAGARNVTSCGPTIAQQNTGKGDGGPATAAGLCLPTGVAVDAKGNVYIAENSRVRKVNSSGTITTIAGTGKLGYSGDGGPATRARVKSPMGVAVDAKGNVYIAQASFTTDGVVRKVSRNGTITTIAGPGPRAGCGRDCEPRDGSRATAAQIKVQDVAVDRQGNVYIVGSSVYHVTPGGTITTFAGHPSLIVDGRRVQMRPEDDLLPKAVAVYGPGTLVIVVQDRVLKVTKP